MGDTVRSNNPPYAEVSLTKDQFELLEEMVAASQSFLLSNVQSITSQDGQARIINKLETLKTIRSSLTQGVT